MRVRLFFRRLLKTLLAIVLLILFAVISLLIILRFQHNQDVTLPAPTGHFPVGRTTFRWTNDAALDTLAPSSDAKRQLMVWIWYPAIPSPSATPVEYLPAPWRRALEQYSGRLMSTYFTRDLAHMHAHSASDPVVSNEGAPYPVVLMRAGGGL